MAAQQDLRMFIKLHNGFPEHPKTVDLSDKAFRGLVELWCYCSRNLTDGIVKNSQLSRIIPPKTVRELEAAGYLTRGPDSVEMHDYLKHQMSAESVSDLREKRRMAGSMGGKAKANNVASATAKPKQAPSKSVPDKDKDKDTSTYVEGEASQAPPTPKKGHRIPEDWMPDNELVATMNSECPNVNQQAEHRKFVDYWSSQPGAKGVKLDWRATYRNWIRRANESAPKTGNRSTDRMAAGFQAMSGPSINRNIDPFAPKEITA